MLRSTLQQRELVSAGPCEQRPYELLFGPEEKEQDARAGSDADRKGS